MRLTGLWVCGVRDKGNKSQDQDSRGLRGHQCCLHSDAEHREKTWPGGQKGGHHFEKVRLRQPLGAEWCWEGSAGAVLAFRGVVWGGDTEWEVISKKVMVESW